MTSSGCQIFYLLILTYLLPPNDLTREDYVDYRLKLSKETFEAAELLVSNKKWNSAVNRLYYACFYAITALLVSRDISSKTHAGVKTRFFQEFIKSGKIDIELGKLYSDLFDWRQQGDYGDFFDFSEEEILPIIDPVKNLIHTIEKEIYQR